MAGFVQVSYIFFNHNEEKLYIVLKKKKFHLVIAIVSIR